MGTNVPSRPDAAASVLIVGGGLAGLAAAVALAPRGFHAAILEARNRLGGRAGSFQDAASGRLIDACQHVTMGCCTNFAHFCRTVGIDRYLAPQPELTFQTPDGRRSRFRADPWPAPFHLARSFLRAHFLTPMEKLRIGYGLACLQFRNARDDPLFVEWLKQHYQTPQTIERFWSLVLVSALNEEPERVGLRYARKVFVDGFLRHLKGFEVSIPTVPLGKLYGAELLSWLDRHRVAIRFQEAVRTLHVENGRITSLETRHGETLKADWYVSTVPHDRLLDLLPAEVVDREECFRNLRHLESSPITSVHLWFDRPVLDLPHVVLVDCLGQWVFNRGRQDDGHYVQVVISAARSLRGLGHDEVQRQIVKELRAMFARARSASVVRGRVVTEHAATFSAVPGVDRWRPMQASPIDNLLIAGDWTATGWPATMEGAVRSGYLAAEALLKKTGLQTQLVQPDLY